MAALSQTASGLIVVDRFTKPRPVWRCDLCGAQFPEDKHGFFERHVIKCAETHEAELAQEMHERESDVLGSREDDERFRFERAKAIERGIKGKGLN